MKLRRVAALLVGFVLIASSVRAESTPSLNLEGTGDLGPGPGACVAAGCSGSFSATLSGQLAEAVSAAPLQMNLQVGNQICMCLRTCIGSSVPGCDPMSDAGRRISVSGNRESERFGKNRRRTSQPRSSDCGASAADPISSAANERAGVGRLGISASAGMLARDWKRHVLRHAVQREFHRSALFR